MAEPAPAPPPGLPPLDASAAELLAAAVAAGAPPVEGQTPAQVRAAHDAGAAALAGPGEDVAEVRDEQVAGTPVRVYRAAGAGVGEVVYAHGGGWVVGTLTSYDTLCRALANRSGAAVVSVDFDRAPEARHPRQADQVLAVVRERARSGAPLALAGDSAGAHVATLAAANAAADGIPLRALGLVYPVVGPGLDLPSATEVGAGYLLTTTAMHWYWAQYLAPAQVIDPARPVDLRDLDLSVLPPTWVLTAGYDPLRDEGRALADDVAAAGVPVERVEFPGQMHGFVRATAKVPEALAALDALGAFLAARLARAAGS